MWTFCCKTVPATTFSRPLARKRVRVTPNFYSTKLFPGMSRANFEKIKKIKFRNFEKCPIMSASQKSTIKGAPADEVSRCTPPRATTYSSMVPAVAIATAQCPSKGVIFNIKLTQGRRAPARATCLLPASRPTHTGSCIPILGKLNSAILRNQRLSVQTKPDIK